MDASRLHAVLQDIRGEYDRLSVNNLVQQLIATLDQIAAAPADTAHMAAYKAARNVLIETLREAPSNRLSPTKTMLCKQIGAIAFAGTGLLERVDDALRENLVTPQAAAAAVRAIQSDTNRFMTMAAELMKGLDALGIRPDSVAPGEMEVGLSLPRIDEVAGIKNLATDLKRLDETLMQFAQITGANLDSSKLTRLASNDWQVFLSVTPEIAACVAFGIERIVALYKNLLEIRKLKRDAEEKKMPQEILDLMQQQIDSRVKEGIEQAANELVEKFADQSKRHGREIPEMKNAAKQGLTYLAAKIDSGATIEITVSLPLAPTGPAGDPDANAQEALAEFEIRKLEFEEKTEQFKAIGEQGRAMLTLTHSPQPILHLTDAGDAPPAVRDETKPK